MRDENEDADDIDEEELETAEAPAVAAGLHTLTVDETDAGTRLDRFVTGKLGLSRSRVQALIRDGYVEGTTGPLKDAGSKVRTGQALRVNVPPPEPASPLAQELPLKRMPAFDFRYDAALEEGDRTLALLRELETRDDPQG